MLTFNSFRSGLGGRFVRDEFRLDISSLQTWREFTHGMVRHIGKNHATILDEIRERFGTCSTGEKALMLSILHAADFCALADELAETAKVSFLHLMKYTDGAMADAAVACLARKN